MFSLEMFIMISTVPNDVHQCTTLKLKQPIILLVDFSFWVFFRGKVRVRTHD